MNHQLDPSCTSYSQAQCTVGVLFSSNWTMDFAMYTHLVIGNPLDCNYVLMCTFPNENHVITTPPRLSAGRSLSWVTAISRWLKAVDTQPVQLPVEK